MTKDEALDLALETLETGQNHGVAIDKLRRYIKQARSAPVQKPYRPLQDNGSQYFGDSWDTLPTQSAPVQPVPCCGKYETCTQACTPRGKFLGARDAAAQPAVPAFNGVATKKLDSLIERGCQINGLSFEQTEDGGAVTRGAITCGGMVLWWNQTFAAQRQWVGLTDEEFEDIELGCRSTLFGKIEAMRKVEAKLKEKNNG